LSEDTIAAVASPAGTGAVSLIRMSGPDAIGIADRVFGGRTTPSQARDRSVLLGEIRGRDGDPIDQVLLVIMRAPRSLTGEDTVEINCHGGNMAPLLVLRRVIEEGARPAEAGEFTKRAFFNGKMDLAQAEAVSEIVQASSEKALKVAVRQLRGELSDRLERLEQSLLGWLALIEANIDFVDDEVDPVDTATLAKDLEHMVDELGDLLEAHAQGRYVKQGLDVAIVGRANVGKSSLFNRLIGRDRVIVSQEPGTTRDVVDGLVGVNGMMLRLHDTAGLGIEGGPIEAEAERRSISEITQADIALVVLDTSEPLCDQDLDIILRVEAKTHLIIANKTDLPEQAETAGLGDPIRISALKGWGITELLDGLKRAAHMKVGALNYEIIVNERHAACIAKALEAVSRARASLPDAVPLELTASDIRNALDDLGRVTGRSVSSSVLDEIFSRFCIGK
jgi:tRNA modification GTPase